VLTMKQHEGVLRSVPTSLLKQHFILPDLFQQIDDTMIDEPSPRRTSVALWTKIFNCDYSYIQLIATNETQNIY
jgi:hypothetical protein